jgi:hypothetical protein
VTQGDAAGRHLDDLDLTDLVDGRASDWAADHAASCADCGQRLARVREVSRMVGGLAGVVPEGAGTRRAQAVAAALADERPKALLARIGPRPPWWAAAAAAAIALGGSLAGLQMTGGLSGGGGSHPVAGAANRSTATSASGPIAGAVAGSAGSMAAGSSAAGSPTATGASAAVVVPPLGAVAGPQQLVEDLKSRLAAVPAAGPAQGSAGSGGSAGAGPSSNTARSGPAGDYANSPAAGPASASVSAGASTGASTAVPERGSLSCLAAADALQLIGPARTLLLQATLVYGGAPAQVFVFGAQSQHIAVVMRPTACQTVTTVSF